MKSHRFVIPLFVAALVCSHLAPPPAHAQTTPFHKNETSVAANDKYVYVVRGNKLYKFDAASLTLLRQASFPAHNTNTARRTARRTRATHTRIARPVVSLRVKRSRRKNVPLPP